MPEGFDVFLSHNSRDKPVVEEIAEFLRGQGLRVWLDKDELRPGFPWQEGLEEGVRASRSVAVFIGADGIGAWQTPETRAFLARSKQKEIPVIPVLLPGCPDSPQLSLFLEAMTWVDLRQGLTEDGLARLVWGITGTKSETPAPPPKPPRHWRSRVLAVSLLAVLVTLAVWLWRRSPGTTPPPPRPYFYAVRVLVLNPQGLPVTGSTVRASTSNEPKRISDGWWEIEIPAAKVPADGQVTLWVQHPDWGGNRKDLHLGTDPNIRAEIRLKEPESELRGQVVDESGHPLAGARVLRQDGAQGETMADAHGRFAFKLSVPPDTSIRVRAEHQGLAPAENYCLAGHDTCTITLEKP